MKIICTEKEKRNIIFAIQNIYDCPFEHCDSPQKLCRDCIKDKLEWEIVEEGGESSGEWIPCSERLPEPQKEGNEDYSDWVQVTINDDNDVFVCEAYYCFSENKWYAKRFVVGEVTAWMPLPEPYKAGDSE